MGASKGRIKERRERVALDVSKPILLAELGAIGANTLEERDDGTKGVGQVSAPRPGRKTKRPLTVSVMQHLEAAAAWTPDWERAAAIDVLMQHDGPGRRMDTNAMTMIVFGQAVAEFAGSAQCAQRELADPANWSRLYTAAEVANPNDLTRRLHPRPPTYKQWWRFRNQYLGDVERLRHDKRVGAVKVARQIGLLNPENGSVTNPSRDNVVVGEAKVLNGMFNTPPIDPKTGQPSTRRHDPDMDTYHKGDKRTGRRMVSATTRSDHFNERVMLDVTTMHVTEGNDGTRFTDMVLELNEVLGFPVPVAGYDMALYAANHDRLMAAGTAPVGKVHRDAKSQPKSIRLGEHTFKLTDGSERTLPVVVVDGWPGIIIPTVEGPKWAALAPVQVKNAPNKNGTWRWWQYWAVRDVPEVERALRGAVVHIRHSHSDKYDGDQSRSQALRLFPEGSPGYNMLFPKRNDIESMHRHLKDLMFNDRVSTIGDRNLRIWLHTYQTRVNRTALIAWHYRTGGDISPWFGEWRPPPQRQQAAA